MTIPALCQPSQCPAPFSLTWRKSRPASATKLTSNRLSSLVRGFISSAKVMETFSKSSVPSRKNEATGQLKIAANCSRRPRVAAMAPVSRRDTVSVSMPRRAATLAWVIPDWARCRARACPTLLTRVRDVALLALLRAEVAGALGVLEGFFWGGHGQLL